tara:strand:- start:384 stop:650 length:267 start_codon:yes stop_codon:yes gene_type:complete
MLSSCLLSGLIIGSISTCVYALITDKRDKDRDLEYEEKKDKKMDYLVIFSIIMLVSVIILYFTNKNNTEQVVPLKGGFSPKVNNQPPF